MRAGSATVSENDDRVRIPRAAPVRLGVLWRGRRGRLAPAAVTHSRNEATRMPTSSPRIWPKTIRPLLTGAIARAAVAAVPTIARTTSTAALTADFRACRTPPSEKPSERIQGRVVRWIGVESGRGSMFRGRCHGRARLNARAMSAYPDALGWMSPAVQIQVQVQMRSTLSGTPSGWRVVSLLEKALSTSATGSWAAA